jgi:hypothetical protein
VGWTGTKCNIPVPLPEESTSYDPSGTTTPLTTPDESTSSMESSEESEESTEDGKSAELLPTHGAGGSITGNNDNRNPAEAQLVKKGKGGWDY